MSTEDRILILSPVLILAAAGTYWIALELRSKWWPQADLAAAGAVAAALHAAWLGAAFRRRALLGGFTCWLVCAMLAASSGIHALAAESIAVLLSLGYQREPIPDRLARWRRTRALIRAELENGTGLRPWWNACRRALVHNDERRDTALERARFLVEMRDAERVASALPSSLGRGGTR